MRSRKRTKITKSGCLSGKLRYADKTSALAGMRGTQQRRGAAGAVRVYRCDRCQGWHLTSRVS